jgi:hypothetical protein
VPSIGGRPCTIWLDLFTLCHRPTEAGWQLVEWPDGQPLLAQPWLQTAVFRVIGDELLSIRNERLRSRARQQG